MRVENFKRFDIGSDHGDDASFLLAFQFCGAKHAKRAEDFISERRKQSERNVVIAVLLYIS